MRHSVAVMALIWWLGTPAALAVQTVAKRVQCWTDERGQRACGDAVPQQYVRRERQVFDDQGRVRQIKPREKTVEEVAAEQQLARDTAEAAQRAQKQRDYDRFLLSTYDAAADIERARDERLTMIDGRRKLAEKAVADNEKAVAQQQRIGGLVRAGKTAPPVLDQKLQQLRQSLDVNRQALLDLASEKQRTTEKYAADLLRYRQLRSTAAAY